MKLDIVKSLEAATSWGYIPHGDVQEAECLCAQAFSFRGPKKADELDRIPGPPNEIMGDIVCDLVRKYGLPYSIQGEIAKSETMRKYVDSLDDHANDFEQVIFHNPLGGYVSCYTIETLTWEWMKGHHWSKVVLVTHPLLCWRMERVMCRLAEKDNLPLEIIIPPGLEKIGYDPWNGTQWRGWNEQFWWAYEMLARQHHILVDWI